MNIIQELLETRKKYLLNIQKEKKKALIHTPQGTLRLCCSKNTVQYYNRTDQKNFNGTYIPKENFALAQKLSQKDYDTKFLRSCEHELLAIQGYNSHYPDRIFFIPSLIWFR